VEWYSDPRVEYGLLIMRAGPEGDTLLNKKGNPTFLPVDAFVCRICRFVRLQSARGDLEIRFPAQ